MFKVKPLFRRMLFIFALFSTLVILFASRDTTEAASNLYTFYPTANTAYMANPSIGWQSDGTTTDFLPETTTYAERSDISWQILNPSSGVYDWSALDNAMQTAIAQQKQFSFRVYTMRGEEWGGHQVPQWVLDNGAEILNDGSPDYSNCTYQHEWTRFVNALRLRYDGIDDIAFIDISGYGDFNEWSWNDNQTEWENNPNTPTTLDGKARNRLAFAFIGGADSQHRCRDRNGNTQTVSYSYTGFQQTQLVMPYAGIRQMTAVVASRRPDVGIRYDCLGRSGSGTSSSDGLMAKIGQQIEATWRNAPIIYEFCGVTTEEQYMNEADILLRASHGTMVHDNLRGTVNTNRVTTLMQNVGYRYQLDYARFYTTVASGENFTVEMLWRNIGYAPSYPRMGQNFEIHVYLVNAQGNTVVNALIDSQIHTWMPAHPLPGTAPANTVYDVFTMPSLPAGDYSFRVAIVDARTSRPMNLAINGRDAAGRYTLGTVRITNTAAPTATITNTPSPQPTMTNTPLPLPTMTNTPLPTMTSTPIPATNTPLPLPTMTNTPLPVPTMTSTPFTIPTATPIPPVNASPTPIPPLPTNPPVDASPTPIPPIGATSVPPMPTATLVPNVPSDSGGQIHLHDVDGWTTDSRRGRWSAQAEIRVHDANEERVSNVTVTGVWSLDNSVVTCVTDNRGRCSVFKENIERSNRNITFTVTSISHPNYTYAPQANHDQSGGGVGAVTIWR